MYVLVGNGELNEGSNWESIMFAGSNGLNNIVLIVDDNKMQNDGESSAVLPVSDWGTKLKSFNWTVQSVDGHNTYELENSLKQAKSYDGPIAIIANTIKGKGISFMENVGSWHHSKMNEKQYLEAIKEV